VNKQTTASATVVLICVAGGTLNCLTTPPQYEPGPLEAGPKPISPQEAAADASADPPDGRAGPPGSSVQPPDGSIQPPDGRVGADSAGGDSGAVATLTVRLWGPAPAPSLRRDCP
jgi:hypothetical protein